VLIASSGNYTSLGDIYISTDGGANWTSQSKQGDWESVDISHDGTKVVIASHNGTIHTGAVNADRKSWTWTEHWPSEKINRVWSAVAMSADGGKMVAAEQNGWIYVFTAANLAAPWKRVAHQDSWSSVAMSADGRTLVAGATGDTADRRIYTSINGGDTWTTTSSGTLWTSVAITDDGATAFAVPNSGQIFASRSRTTMGVTGSISGTPSDAAELIYLGDGVYSILSKVGDLKIR
jgi:hypothetical protein